MVTGWDRVAEAVERVRDRLYRTAAALESAGVPYAVAGGNAVAEWVGRADAAAVRNTHYVDILLRRADLPAAITAMEAAGFVYRHAASIDMFLDGPGAKARAVHVVFAGEKVRQEYPIPAPDVSDSESTGKFQVLSLESLVTMKLTSFRDKDRMHLRDMLDFELIDVTRVPAALSPRLQELLDNPEG